MIKTEEQREQKLKKVNRNSEKYRISNSQIRHWERVLLKSQREESENGAEKSFKNNSWSL